MLRRVAGKSATSNYHATYEPANEIVSHCGDANATECDLLKYPITGIAGRVVDGFAVPLSAKRLNSPDGVERGRARKGHYPRESKDSPNEKAFCLVAPTVLLSDFAILLAGVFCFARLFSSRTSVAVHARLLAFLAISPPS